MGKKKSTSPYWDWTLRNRPYDDTGTPIEIVNANPDRLPAKVEPEKSEELKAAIEVLNEGGLQVLTNRQRMVFTMVVMQGLSLRAAARIMGISHQVAGEHLVAAGKKLRGLCRPKL